MTQLNLPSERDNVAIANEYKERILKRLKIVAERLEAANNPLDVEAAIYFITQAVPGTKTLLDNAFAELHELNKGDSIKTPLFVEPYTPQ